MPGDCADDRLSDLLTMNVLSDSCSCLVAIEHRHIAVHKYQCKPTLSSPEVLSALDDLVNSLLPVLCDGADLLRVDFEHRLKNNLECIDVERLVIDK